MSSEERWRRSPQVGPDNHAADLERELAFHLDELVRQLETEGFSPEAARAEAVRRFGTVSAVARRTSVVDRREARSARRLDWLRGILVDIRFAGRLFRRNPAFTLFAALSIGLGVGVTAAMLSAAHSILLRPLPYPDADRLVSVYSRVDKRNIHRSNISYQDFLSWRDMNKSFTSLGLMTWASRSFTDGQGGAERVNGSSLSPEVLPLIGVRPILGRWFTEAESRAGAAPVILLGHALWVRRYGADSTIVGRTVIVDGSATEVVGVMPSRFTFDGEQAWVPFVGDPTEGRGNRWRAGAIGRLKPGVTIEAARADLEIVGARLEREFPVENLDWRPELISIRDDLVGNLRRPLQIFLAAVGCLLLIVSANIANLLLARGFGRRREMAVRAAIGAGHGRLLRQLLIESLALALLGGIVGIGIAAGGLALLGRTFPDGVPAYLTLGLDLTAVGITLGVAGTTGLLAGFLPAIRAASFDLSSTFRDGGATGGSARSGQLRTGLVVVEIALSVVLLIGGGLLLKSFAALASTDLGFERRGLLSARISLPAATYQDESRWLAFYDALHARLGALPGVTSVGSAQGAPMSGWNVQAPAVIDGKPDRAPDDPLVVHFQSVSSDYFATLGVPLLEGRHLTSADRDTSHVVAVINDILATREFGTKSPLGARIRFGDGPAPANPRWITVVGVIKSFRHYRLPDPMGPALYLSQSAFPERQQDLVVRTDASDPASLLPSIRAAVREIDPTVPLFRPATFDETLGRVLWQQRLQGQVFVVFASLALLVATIGIYGVISYNVSQRTRELGVRAAIGASRGDLSRMVLRDGVRLALLGTSIGVVASLLSTRLLASLLYGVAARDLAVFVAAPLALGAVAILASWLPAVRAARADPLAAIRSE